VPVPVIVFSIQSHWSEVTRSPSPCWPIAPCGHGGSTTWGQLGDSTQTSSTVPVHVDSLQAVIDVDAGSSFALALRRDSTLWAWGINFQGQLVSPMPSTRPRQSRSTA
jgi:alpha-tubulin suppressor-like RCC1 family protein